MSWFSPPEPIGTEVHARLPDRFRRPRRTAWSDANKAGAELDCFLEGPAFDRQGNLYVTDIPFGRIFRLDRDGEWALVAEYDGWPNGLRVAADGQLLVADYRLGLLRIDPNSGSVTPVLSAVRSEGFKGLNDLTIAGNGDVYFTDQGQTGMQDPTGRVYRLATDGRLERLLDTCASPNGIVFNAAGTHLYVALTRACQVWRVPVTRDAVVGKANVFAQLPGGVSGPDGLAMDIEDGLAIADPGHACVWLLDRHGVPRHRIMSCAGRTLTNVAYQGLDLFITNSETGQILKARAPVPGQPLSTSHDQGATA